jgi:hypothetical protein
LSTWLGHIVFRGAHVGTAEVAVHG